MAALTAIAPGRGYVEAGVGKQAGMDPYAYVDAVAKVTQNLAAFAQVQVTAPDDYTASAGVRYTW